MAREAERTDSGRAWGSCFDAEVRMDLADLTRDFTHDLMNGDGEADLDRLDANFAFVASSPGQSSFDREDYLRVARAIGEDDIRIVLTNQSYVAVPVHDDYCCVVALFRVFLSTGSGTATLRGVAARLCFHWSLAEGEPRLLSLESSFAVGLSELAALDGQSAGPVEPGFRDLFQDEQLIELRDDRRVSHFVTPDGVLYVEARGHKCVVHCLEDVFEVNEGISVMEERFGPAFVRLHRSYLVNPWHLRTLSERGSTLDDGEVLPVPARRVEELRERLRRVRRPKGDMDGIGTLLTGGRI